MARVVLVGCPNDLSLPGRAVTRVAGDAAIEHHAWFPDTAVVVVGPGAVLPTARDRVVHALEFFGGTVLVLRTGDRAAVRQFLATGTGDAVPQSRRADQRVFVAEVACAVERHARGHPLSLRAHLGGRLDTPPYQGDVRPCLRRFTQERPLTVQSIARSLNVSRRTLVNWFDPIGTTPSAAVHRFLADKGARAQAAGTKQAVIARMLDRSGQSTVSRFLVRERRRHCRDAG